MTLKQFLIPAVLVSALYGLAMAALANGQIMINAL